MSAEKLQLFIIKGMIGELPADDQAAVQALSDEFIAKTKAAGDTGSLAFTLAFATMAAEKS